jgi:hypothetical protein
MPNVTLVRNTISKRGIDLSVKHVGLNNVSNIKENGILRKLATNTKINFRQNVESRSLPAKNGKRKRQDNVRVAMFQ